MVLIGQILSVIPNCIGALAGILARVGSVQFHYTEEDKRHLHYRLSRFLSEMRQAGAPDKATDEKSQS
jgi:hypothetical protein